MTRRRFLINPQDIETGWVTLGPEVAHQVRTVLRLRSGDRIELRDGCGHAWEAVLGETTGREVRAAVGRKTSAPHPSPLLLTLALAFSRADRMELVLRQATEMGVDRFIAFPAERSEYRLAGPGVARRKERWQRIAGEALCQCGRMHLPAMEICADLGEFISSPWVTMMTERKGLKILAREQGERWSLQALYESHQACREMLVVIGPEGGWSQREGERFLDGGFWPVHLGPRTLRLETAAVALLAAVQLLWGDFGSREAWIPDEAQPVARREGPHQERFDQSG